MAEQDSSPQNRIGNRYNREEISEDSTDESHRIQVVRSKKMTTRRRYISVI